MLLNVVNLTKQYNGKHGIQGLNLTVSEGEVVALLGPNGAGKTTAMKAMMGMIPLDSGEVFYKQNSIMNKPEATRNEIGMMIGEPAPYLYLTAYQYLKMHQNLYTQVIDYDIQQVLDIVGLIDRQNSKIKTFSTGMKQRLCLAKVLLIKPKLILLDEPFSGMDIEGRNQLVQILNRIVNESKVAMIISSHLIHDIEALTSKVCIVGDGKWLETKNVSEIRDHFKTIEEYYLGVRKKVVC